MKLTVYRIFGITSILIGLVMDCDIIWAYFWIDYFYGPLAIFSLLGLFICYVLLIAAGTLFLLNKKQSIFLYKLFLLGIVLDRFLVYTILDIHLLEVFYPILTAIPILLFLMYSHWGTYAMNYKKE